MNIIPIIKLGAGLVTSFGAGAVVGNVIKATTPATLKPVTKVLVVIGGGVLAAAAGDLAANYVEASIQGVADTVKIGKRTKEVFKEGYADGVQEAAEEAAAANEKLAKETKKAAKDVVDEVTKEDKPEADAS